jgi:N-acetylmuramoyl-L-alanine amidase
MSNRTAKIVVSVLMLIGFAILVFAATGILNIESRALPEHTTREPMATSTPAPTTPPTESSATAAPTEWLWLRPDLAEPPYTGGLRRWPAASSLPEIRQPNLSAYEGRSLADKPLAGVTVILDAGHGGQDGGTVYPTSPSNPVIVEKDINLAVALKARDRLRELGAEVVMTRETDEWLSIYKRIAIAGQYAVNHLIGELPSYGYKSEAIESLVPLLNDIFDINSDLVSDGGRGFLYGYGSRPEARLLFDIQAQYPEVLFISLHCNAYVGDSRVRGLQVYYQTNEGNYKAATRGAENPAETPPVYTGMDDAGRLRLATALRERILKQLPALKFNGHSDLLIADYAVLRNINLVSVLVEMGFVTSPHDREILLSNESQEKIAVGIAEAVYQYYCR